MARPSVEPGIVPLGLSQHSFLPGKAVSDSPFSLRQSRRKMLRAFLQFSPSLHGLHSAVLKATDVCFPGLAAEFAESPRAPHRGEHTVL